MRPTFDRRLWILLFWYTILSQCFQIQKAQQIHSQEEIVTSLTGQNRPELVDTKSQQHQQQIKKESKHFVTSSCANCLNQNATTTQLPSGSQLSNEHQLKTPIIGQINLERKLKVKRYRRQTTSVQKNSGEKLQRFRHQDHLNNRNSPSHSSVKAKPKYQFHFHYDDDDDNDGDDVAQINYRLNFNNKKNVERTTTTTVQTIPSQLPSSNSVLPFATTEKMMNQNDDVTSPLPPDNSLHRPPYYYYYHGLNAQIENENNSSELKRTNNNGTESTATATIKSENNIVDVTRTTIERVVQHDDDDEMSVKMNFSTKPSNTDYKIQQKQQQKQQQPTLDSRKYLNIDIDNDDDDDEDEINDGTKHDDDDDNAEHEDGKFLVNLQQQRRLAKRNTNHFDIFTENSVTTLQQQQQIISTLSKPETSNPNINDGINSHDNNDADISDDEQIPDKTATALISSSDIRKSDIRYNKTLKQPQQNSLSFSITTTTAATTTSSIFPLTTISSSNSITTPKAATTISSSSSSISSKQENPYLSNSKTIEINNNETTTTKLFNSMLPINVANVSNLNLSKIQFNNNNNNNYKIINNNNRNNNDNLDENNSKMKKLMKIKKKLTTKVTRKQIREPIVIIDEAGEEFDSGYGTEIMNINNDNINNNISSHNNDGDDDYQHDEPLALPLRPIIRAPYDEIDSDDEEMSIVYAEQHSEIKLMCEVDLDIATSEWFKNRQRISSVDRTSRVTDYRFIKETNGGLTINNVMLEDDGKWQCKAENSNGYAVNARAVKLVVLDRPKPPYLLIDSRRLDAGNSFVPVKENSELSLACISEGGNPKPTLTWEVLLSPGVDHHAQKVAADVLELEEIKIEKDKEPYKFNTGAKSEARLPAVYRAHHNARILCVMEHPTLKIRQNASLLLDVQYTPSFAISRIPGFGYPLREGIEVSLKCDVDSNPSSTPRWQKDDGDTPVPQTGDGFLNFTSIRREHSGWYKCTSRHLNFQYSSIGYYLSVRYDSVDVTSEPDDQEVSVAAASHNPNKGQLEVQLGGAVTLQCPQGSLGCWSHLDPVTAKFRGLGYGLTSPTGQFSLKDVVYQDAGTYKCIGQSPNNKKKLEVLQTVGLSVKGSPTATPRNATPVAYPGSPLHLSVEFCANPAAHAARWLHGDRVYTPGNQYGSTVLAYGVTDLPTPFCKEARLTYVSMHERVPRTFYFIVSSPGGVAEATFKVNFTLRYRIMSNAIDDEEEELAEPEEIHFPVFSATANSFKFHFIQISFTTNLSLIMLNIFSYFYIL